MRKSKKKEQWFARIGTAIAFLGDDMKCRVRFFPPKITGNAERDEFRHELLSHK